jgi:uncharacterized protein with FMN-binding domain
MRIARLVLTTVAAGAAATAGAASSLAAAQTTGIASGSLPPLGAAASTASAAGRWLLGSPRASVEASAQRGSLASPTVAKRRSATGEEVNYRYGIIAVRAFVSGTRLVKVTIPVLQVDAQLSGRLAQYSLPLLEGEAIRAQSAKVAAVSGATWTSEGFAMSLQSALTKLRAK